MTIIIHLSTYLQLCYFSPTLAVFTLETNYPPETGYLLGSSRQTDNTSQFENETVLILDGQSP